MNAFRFNAYFPHIDNVYSHRSTQRYKRKPFVSYYWDCRLKGRPPGTPKSDDPNKKKRKRTARQRDLCDVKIKITEYFPGFTPELTSNEPDPSFPSELLPGVNALFDQSSSSDPSSRDPQPFGMLTPNPALTEAHPGANGERFFTIQRVNGNGANGKNDGIGGGHRHTLADSDRVKKSSVQRHAQNEVRNKRKSNSVCIFACPGFVCFWPLLAVNPICLCQPCFCRLVQDLNDTNTSTIKAFFLDIPCIPCIPCIVKLYLRLYVTA